MDQDPKSASGDVEERTALCRRIEEQRTVVRRSISLLIVGVIAIGVCAIWATVTDFRYHRLTEFTAALNAEAARISPSLVRDARGMVNRLYPHYVTCFAEMFERDWDKMRTEAHTQIEMLDAYAQSKWPEIEKALLDVVLTSQDVLQEELHKVLPAAEARQIKLAYGEALEAKRDEIMSGRYRPHIEVAREIGVKLEQIVATEPDIQPPVDMKETLGILLELAGVELQHRYN